MEAKKEQTLEELLKELEALMLRMEQNDLALDESFALYEEGVHKLKLCNQKIDYVEKKIMILNEQDDDVPAEAGAES